MSIKLTNLTIEIKNKIILNNLNLEINEGETVIILGPNGHGKSTILKSIMRHYDTNIKNGEISINNENINNLQTDEIVNKFKVYFAMQNPVEIPGLTTIELLRNELSQNKKNISVIELFKKVNQEMKNLQMNPELLNRSVNNNFSGGEKKKNEILQLEMLDPEIILLDEIDSGLDIDAVDLIATILKKYKEKKRTIIYISHNDRLLKHLPPEKSILVMNGQIVEIADSDLSDKINKIGYKKYALEKGIVLKENNDDEFNKSTLKDYHCNGK